MNRLKTIAIAIFLVGATTQLFAADVLYFTSTPGSWIGQGQTLTFRSPATAFSTFRYHDQGAYTNAVQLRAAGYELAIVGPNFTLPTVGLYNNATRWPFMGSGPGMAFTAPGRGDNELTGYFHVRQAEYNPDGSSCHQGR